MLKIMVSGKPISWRDITPKEGSNIVAAFILEEKRFVDGAVVTVQWDVRVPKHKAVWAKKQVERGYTVIVEANDFVAHSFDQKSGGVNLLLMLHEIQS